MLLIFGILVMLASVILGLIVLVQNPKGGGLTGSLGGFSNQFMGVKQTTDVLEKGTWLFAGIVGLLCLGSVFFISRTTQSGVPDKMKDVGGQTVPATTQPTQNSTTFPQTANPDTPK